MSTLMVKRALGTFFSLLYGTGMLVILFFAHLVTRFRYLRNARNYSKRPSILDHPKWGKHHMIQVNGKVIHYVAKGKPDDPIIVFLHGFPDFWFTWKSQLTDFGSNGYYSVAIDLPGYGESSKILEKGQRRLDLIAGDLARVIESLLKSPKQKVVLVGHDWGAMVGFYLAHNHPDLVSKLVVINGPHPKQIVVLLWTNLKQFILSWYILLFTLPHLPEVLFQAFDFYYLKVCFRGADGQNLMSDSDLEPWKYIYSEPGATTSALGYYRDNIDFFLEIKDLRIKQPMMCIWGEADLALSSQLATMMAKEADNLRLRTIESCGHFTPLEQPVKVNQYISEFINE